MKRLTNQAMVKVLKNKIKNEFGTDYGWRSRVADAIGCHQPEITYLYKRGRISDKIANYYGYQKTKITFWYG